MSGRKRIAGVTRSQFRALIAVRDFYKKHGFAPTHAELADVLNLSRGTVSDVLRQLQTKGYLAVLQYGHRAIRVTPRGWNLRKETA